MRPWCLTCMLLRPVLVYRSSDDDKWYRKTLILSRSQTDWNTRPSIDRCIPIGEAVDQKQKSKHYKMTSWTPLPHYPMVPVLCEFAKQLPPSSCPPCESFFFACLITLVPIEFLSGERRGGWQTDFFVLICLPDFMAIIFNLIEEINSQWLPRRILY